MIASTKPGIYALASLDGSPIRPADRETLRLQGSTASQGLSGLAVKVEDALLPTQAASFHRTQDGLLVLDGYLDEPNALAAELGVNSSLSPAALALLALDKFGSETSARMVGEWSLLRWSTAKRELTLLCSENLRDPIFWASDGQHVAVAPHPMALGHLPWVGLSLNPAGLLLSMSRAGLRRIRERETVWKGIYAVEPATCEVFSYGSQRTIQPASIPLPAPFRGDFEEAVAELNTLGRHIVGQNLRRYKRAGFLLSGGIDSTLVTTLGAQERDSGVEMFCVTSVAPDGSELTDEREFSTAVAAQLGLQVRFVFPAPEASIYFPSESGFAFSGQPVMSLRHHLYEALQSAASVAGAHALFDGVMGEMSVTEKPGAENEANWLRRLGHTYRFRQKERRRRAGWPIEGFHVRFSAQILETLPDDWRAIWRAGMPQAKRLPPTALRGLHPALAKNTAIGSATPHGVRRLLPFRDRRLVRFAATLPYGYGTHQGQSRAMARAMLRGHIPESVRLRPRGLPFSPDYMRRLSQQAPAARQRVNVFREAGIGRWLDLDWLSLALDRTSTGADPYDAQQNQAQITAMAAEFFLWCKSSGVSL